MGKILVIDDDVNVRNTCYDALSERGHKVLTNAFNTKILELVKHEKPDLILIDIETIGEPALALMNGLSLRGDLKIPVVAFIASVTPELEKKIYEAGGIEVFEKKIPVAELCAKLDRILDAKKRLFGQAPDLNAKILLVDDEPEIREFLMGFFESKGFRVFQAENGEEALLVVAKEKPNTVLLDISMPGMDGILTLKKIREMDPAVGVVMATSINDDKIMREATRLGAYAYVLKPFDLQYLELVVLTRMKIAG